MTQLLAFTFSGSTVAWYGLSKAAIEKVRPDLPALAMGNTTTTSGFYRIDNGEAVPFTVDISGQPVKAELNPYSTLLFQTHPTDPGLHTLTVFYDGNSTVWPLTLDYLTVQNSLIGATASGGSTHGTTSHTATIAGAVGGVVGGLLVIFLGLFMLRKYRRRQQKRHRQTRVLQLAQSDIKLRPFTRMVDPVEKTTPATGQYPFSADGGTNLAQEQA